VNTGDETQNPVCVIRYNKWMGGINLKDQLLQIYKSTMKLFRRLLNATVLTAMIIHRHNTRKQINQLEFWVNLVEVLFQQFVDTERKYQVARLQKKIIPRLHERHFIQKNSSFWEKINTTEEILWYAPNTDGGKTQGFAAYSVMSDCVWRHI
jgi:hypothetical protein